MSYLAEQSVIGALLIDGSTISQIYADLKPDMFTNKALRLMYTEFLKGFDNNYKVDAVMLEHKLSGSSLQKEEFMAELRACIFNTSTSVGIKEHANIVICDYKTLRAREILSTINISPERINSQIGGIIQELETLQGRRSELSKTLAQIVRENKDNYFTDNTVPKLFIGFSKIDDFTGGLEGGDVIVIGARPGVGKSAFATQIVKNLSKQGKHVGYYNLEMREKQMYERLAAAESGIDLNRIRRATRFLGDEKDCFDKANAALGLLENIVITSGSHSAGQIKAESKYMGYDIIVIDYLQLLKPETGYKGNRYAEVGEISRTVKSIAMELNIPVILLSQLNRISTFKGDNEPTMAELRESGDIEQDASIIMLLWDLNDNGDKKGCKIAKNRQGTTGSIVLKFDGAHMQFSETNEDMRTAKEGIWQNTNESTPFD